ncbi:MAG: DUF3473 domain-containing protein, partial [Salinivirgaceae bacterium]|nr:DUF3473 domain-containing protein [Salinivirgaceae bacterium]
GHDIGCHSDVHTNLSNQDLHTFKAETKMAINSIEQLIGQKVKMYRAPAFSLTKQTRWALDVLIELGIEIDSSIFPASRSFGGFPQFSESKPLILTTEFGSIKEFPVSYSTIANKRFMFAGGGYFRIFPYNIIKSLLSKSDYNMAYFHLRDFDSKQKQVYSLRYLQSYYGIGKAWSKFERLINDFDFISISEAVNKIDWARVNKIQM